MPTMRAADAVVTGSRTATATEPAPPTDGPTAPAGHAHAPAGARLGRPRPGGLTPGAAAFVGTWAVAFSIARLTGAASVVLLLVAGAVGLLGATFAGWWRLRTVTDVAVTGPPLVEVGEWWPLEVVVHDRTPDRAPLALTLSTVDTPATTVAIGPSPGDHGRVDVVTTTERAGTIRELSGWIGTTGTGGLVWWRRRLIVDVTSIAVAPRATGPLLDVQQRPNRRRGTAVRGRGRHLGDIDGIRRWRDGEDAHGIHWPSTIRAGQPIAHDRAGTTDTEWLVALDADPARLRFTLLHGLRAGHAVSVSGADRDGAERVRTPEDAARVAVEAADRVAARSGSEAATTVPPRRRVDEAPEATVNARWATAFTAMVAVNMLLGALDHSFAAHLAATLGIVVGAALSVRYRDGVAPRWIRTTVTVLALGALGRIAAQASGIEGFVDALRGPMPDLLLVLVVLHGAESANRRTARVHLAITGAVVAYAAGLRIDDRVGWWLLVWSAGLVWSLAALTTARHDATAAPRPTGGPDATRREVSRLGRAVGWCAVGAVATLAVAGFVPVPSGPASLGLPTLTDESRLLDRPGALAAPDGDQSGAVGAPRRGTLGEVAGYTGFAETLDTSVRGDLGDRLMMRVQAPEAAFWRGQTFTDFDGQVWHVSPLDGSRADGPRIDVPPTMGDLPLAAVPIETFVQTYHVETDLPNVIFAAARPDTIVFDGSVSLRPDGALRADRTLAAGTIYTVVSQRVQVTPEMLRRQGDLAVAFAQVAELGDDDPLAPYLALPASTTDRTVELAERLRVEGSTFDTIRAYEAWLSANTEYDLDAPVPAPGADAVDDYLFESRRGFCEQIASALVVMLRSQGVPARLATGYIPGERDRVSGVWEVRASDAHAWVEVWFPATGWQAFDPTAQVPLAGETDTPTVGADVLAAVLGGLAERPLEIGAVVVACALAVVARRRIGVVRRRRARGPWGTVHDRFVALAGDGVDGTVTAPMAAARLAERLPAGGDGVPDPVEVARLLDRVAFDPAYAPTEDDLARARRDVDALADACARAPVTSSS